MILPEVKIDNQKRKLNEIIFNEEIYARFEPDQQLISRYEENIEAIDKLIIISQNNILIDGYHRLKALERVYGKEYEIECIVHLTENMDYIEIESYSANEKHGKKNSKKETMRNIQRLYAKGHSQETIMNKLSVAKSIYFEATKTQRENEKKERDRKIFEMFLQAWNTQDDIGKELNIDRSTVTKIIENVKNSTNGKNHQYFKPFIYNIWNLNKQDNAVDSHFGAFPQVFMENLLYYHTELFDIVYDPFAGGGTTIDACKKMYRRYYCSDKIIKPGREKDIKEWKIQDGLPKDLKKPNLVFLDPPYWKQAENKYSQDSDDLGNMSLDQFYTSMKNLINQLKDKKVEKIAIVIQPTQYKNENHEWEDHIFKFYEMLMDKYYIEMRYILPYSSQQYTPQVVEKMKNIKKCLCLNRDLIIWRLRK